MNELFIDIAAVADFAENDAVQSHVGQPRFQAGLASLRNQQQLDYHAVAEIKGELFQKLWNHFYANHLNPETTRGREFRDFQRRGGDTHRYYAIFSTIQEEHIGTNCIGRDWHSWPASLQTPHSEAVAEFAKKHEKQIEFHQYLQWQAEIQLAAVGRRSMELGLKIGLLMELPYNADLSGFESWYYDGLLFPAVTMAKTHSDSTVIDPAEGLPMISPSGLKNNLYKPFIEGLRHTMRYGGAVVIRSFLNYFRAPFDLNGKTTEEEAFVDFPFADILGILCLESQRNRCLVIVDHIDLLPEKLQSEVLRRNIFTTSHLTQALKEQGNRLETENFSANWVISTTAPFLVSMKGFWQGNDIALKTADNYFQNDDEKEKAILTRVSDRAHLLISLDRAGLLPEEYSIDPATVTEIDNELIVACQICLVHFQILLISLNDILEIDVQAEPPAMTSQKFWHRRYAALLDNLVTSQEIEAIFPALYLEREVGVIHPSVMGTDRSKRQGLQIPTAFYRLQLNNDFTFRQASEIIPYLSDIGVSHCYVSPFLKARPGSSHGYDIIDHCSLNPEIGNREDFEGFMAALKENGMALLLDIVPNHMGIGPDNQVADGCFGKWSEHRVTPVFFDINWQPQQQDLFGRVLLPVLGDHYGKILESGQLTLCFNENYGTFYVNYFQHRFPVDPGKYSAILQHDLKRLSERLDTQNSYYLELQNLISSFENLPDRQENREDKILIRRRDKEVNKRMLARLCRECYEIQQFIAENVILFNGEPNKPQSFDLLHDLLEQQAYRLAFWRVAADEINYRRFFDINDLAGLRMEEVEVFSKTHQLILDLIATGKVDGLRVDHPDGLYNPYEYFRWLEAAASESLKKIQPTAQHGNNRIKATLYVLLKFSLILNISRKIGRSVAQLVTIFPIYSTGCCLTARLKNS